MCQVEEFGFHQLWSSQYDCFSLPLLVICIPNLVIAVTIIMPLDHPNMHFLDTVGKHSCHI